MGFAEFATGFSQVNSLKVARGRIAFKDELGNQINIIIIIRNK
jgi:hypothetical protein